ncbi:MAG: shikimate dehydrogenase [Opitutae bacterium]|nr:shikimate dehydrogenase [Opitutae bacterium]|tara:strand:+ start:5850 stop:6800 length:951 start_codon:yes stop_codon:yes gene_type:complete
MKPIEKLPEPESTLSIEDLVGWRREGCSLAVLGCPIGHSISPSIHNAALSEMVLSDSRFEDWRYFRFEIPAERLQESLGLFASSGFRGLNLTIPHKVQALDYIDSIDSEATAIGAVNTLVFSEDGKCDGFNTDGHGLERALADDFGFSLEGASVILLGAGGAARAAATRFLSSGCSELWVGNRSSKRLDELFDVLSPDGDQRLEGFALDEIPLNLPNEEGVLIVNATSLGLHREDELPFDLSTFSNAAIVYDMIYNPMETSFLQSARALGMRTANGLSMLVHQAARSLEIWSGAEVPRPNMFAAARKALIEEAEKG